MDDSNTSNPSLNDSRMTDQNADSLSPDQQAPVQSSSSSSTEWLWPMNFGGVPPANYQLYPFMQYAQQAAFAPSQDTVPAALPKIPIPRATTAKTSSQRRRSARACEPCRQRKVKCDGSRPVCRKCEEHDLACSYVDIKRIRDQKQLGSLSKKVERYEQLLRQLESEADPATARKVKKVLSCDELPHSETDGDDSDSSASQGSLEDIDLVKEDLNRSEKSVATGYFGKNSEVAWLQKLEDESERMRRSESGTTERPPEKEIPITTMSYHLDDLAIPFPESENPFALPPKDLADLYFNAYMESVHPCLIVVRKNTFTAQYEQFYNKRPSPPRKWLAVLNMIFAIGCRYCKLTGQIGGEEEHTDDLEYLNRARKLCLSGNVLFEHDDLQQIQVEVLVAFYLIALGQVNRASKFSSMAMRSSISLGINLRFVDEKTHYASKEARSRLWWCIFLLEHLVTSLTGRISGCGEGMSAASLPIPFEEGAASRNPELNEIFRDRATRRRCLQLTILQSDEDVQAAAAWLNTCEPSPTLLFHCIVDLVVIAQTVLNNVYSIKGLREPTGYLEQQLLKHSRHLDMWLRKVPEPYRFTFSEDDDKVHLPPNADHVRERISLAIYYYSARIALGRPCLSHTPRNVFNARDRGSHTGFRSLMSLTCLRAACSVLSILPDSPDIVWLSSVSPWWSILHVLMQSSTALLIGLSTWSDFDTTSDPDLPSLNRLSMITEMKKGLRWIHHMAHVSKAACRAFHLCEGSLRRMAPYLGLDISDIPRSETLPPMDKDCQGCQDCHMCGDGLAMVDDG